MSAPDTNVERQADQHRPSLLGIRGAMIFGALMIALMVGFTLSRGEAPTAATMSSEAGADTGERNGAAGVNIDAYQPGTNVTN